MALMAVAVSAVASVCFPHEFASAQEKAAACDQFDWSIKREQALFSDPNVQTVSSGAKLSTLPAGGVAIGLQPYAKVEYVMTPGRQPKTNDSSGGVVFISNVPQAGRYQVTLSAEAWIDVIQNGNMLPSVAHTGKRDCTGVRKSVRFNLEPGPLTIQLSGVDAKQIKLAILPAG